MQVDRDKVWFQFLRVFTSREFVYLCSILPVQYTVRITTVCQSRGTARRSRTLQSVSHSRNRERGNERRHEPRALLWSACMFSFHMEISGSNIGDLGRLSDGPVMLPPPQRIPSPGSYQCLCIYNPFPPRLHEEESLYQTDVVALPNE
jgi:hypothetical protein